MIYTKTYKKQAMLAVEKLDESLSIVEVGIVELSQLTKDSVKSVRGDYDLEELLDKMMAMVCDLYVCKNTLIEEIEKANEE